MHALNTAAGALMLAAAVSHAAAQSGAVRFDEFPVGTSLDGLTIAGVTFNYHPNGSPLTPPTLIESPGTVSGLRDDFVLRGQSPSNDFVIEVLFPGTVNDFGLSLSTQPFSFLAPIAADVRFFNAADIQVAHFPSMSQTLFPGATLPNGDPVFLVGRTDTSLVFNGVTDAVRAEIRIVGANPSAWYMDNLTYSLVPAPSAPVLLTLAGALAARRRRH